MNSKRNLPLALIVAVAVVGTGCSGINAGGSVSPATFLVPGLGHNPPKPADQDSGSRVASSQGSPAMDVQTVSVVQ